MMQLSQGMRWKYVFLLFSVLLGIIYALPNFFGEDPALQILPIHSQKSFDLGAFQQRLERSLGEQAIMPLSIEAQTSAVLLRFKDPASQLKARDFLAKNLGEDYALALDLAPATPKWLSSLGAEPMKLGLDLRGGVHFLLEVDLETAFRKREEAYAVDLRGKLRQERLRYNKFIESSNGINITFEDEDTKKKASGLISQNYHELELIAQNDGTSIIVKLSQALRQEIRGYIIEQTMTTLRNRVNELGVSEAVVQRQGLERVVVELPGIQDPARAKDLIGKTASLQFLMRDDSVTSQNPKIPLGSKSYRTREGRTVILKKQEILTGDAIISASTGTDRDGRPAVSVRVGGPKLSLFKKATKDNIGKQMAVVYSEIKTEVLEENGVQTKKQTVNEEVISLATIQSALGSNFQITGLEMEESANLALLLRAGALPATINIVEERTVGPSLGQENIQMGLQSIIVGLGLVLGFMWLYYSSFGFISNIALLLNVVFLVAILSLLGATLTLPGMAGIILTVGMAVDANVLIFERIREELRANNSPQASIQGGFERAWATILDSNLTTLIVGIILFGIGTGPVRGFAVTLCIGILTSMFTAVTVTRALIDIGYGGRPLTKVPVGI
jgi:preprotein translocase subunit SecD